MSAHTYYHTCPKCGANLDPGETCSLCEPKQPVIRTRKAEEELAKSIAMYANKATNVETTATELESAAS